LRLYYKVLSAHDTTIFCGHSDALVWQTYMFRHGMDWSSLCVGWS